MVCGNLNCVSVKWQLAEVVVVEIVQFDIGHLVHHD